MCFTADIVEIPALQTFRKVYKTQNWRLVTSLGLDSSLDLTIKTWYLKAAIFRAQVLNTVKSEKQSNINETGCVSPNALNI